MASTKFKLGRPLPAPDRFLPDRTVADERYIYRLDTKRLICHRQPKGAPGAKGDGFYHLILPAKPQRPSTPTARTIKHGIIMPTLIITLLAGLTLLLYPLFPAVHYQVQKHFNNFSNDTSALAAPEPNHNRLVIPKIGVDTTIWEGPTLAIINKHDGVWHQTGNLVGSNFVIAGHRFKYLPPNTSTFYNLGQLQVGDAVVLDWQGSRYFYSVSQTLRVDKHDISVIKPTASTQLTIYTCYDRLQTERTVVIASPQP